MKIKHFLLLAVAIAAIGCSKNPGPSGVKGSYSFKTSGQAELNDTLVVTLPDESGQMQVIDKHDGNALCFTFNQLLGHTYMTSGSIIGDEITLDEFPRQLRLGLCEYDVKVCGKGKVYDDTIILDLDYHGIRRGDTDTTLVSKSVIMTAKRN